MTCTAPLVFGTIRRSSWSINEGPFTLELDQNPVRRQLAVPEAANSVFQRSEYILPVSGELKGPRDGVFVVNVSRGTNYCGSIFFYLAEVRDHRFNQNVGWMVKLRLRFIQAVLSIFLGRERIMLICGNPFTTQYCPCSWISEMSPEEVALLIDRASREVMFNLQGPCRRVRTVMIKDFFPAQENCLDSLRERNFTVFEGEPTLLMPLDPQWGSMSDYEKGLSSKYRTRLHSVMKRTTEIEVKDLNAHEMKKASAELEALYTRVYDQVNFRLGTLPFKALLALKVSLGDEMPIRVLMMEGRCVAFMSAFVHSHELDAHMIGFDQELNEHVPVYQRILYEYVSLALEHRCHRISFGRTAGEIKTTVGAVPVETKCAIKSYDGWKNRLLSRLLPRVKTSSFVPRMAFRKEAAVELISALGAIRFTSATSSADSESEHSGKPINLP